MKTLTISSLSLLLLLALTAVPMVAAPWCASYCSCSSSCFTQCYDQNGASACDAYICDEFCKAPGTKSDNASDTSAENLLTSDLFTAPVDQMTRESCAAPAEELEALPTS